MVRAFERAGKPFTEDKLKGALPRLARASIDDVLAAVGRGEIFSGDVVKAVYPDFSEERKLGPQPPLPPPSESGWFGLPKGSSLVFKFPERGESKSGPMPIYGLRGDLPVRFAPNGGAVPGDRIVAILTPGEHITIYPIQSPDLTAFDDQPELWLDVRWDLDAGKRNLFPARILVTAINEPGTLGIIATAIGDMGANIDTISFNAISPDFREIIIDVEVPDLKHLNGHHHGTAHQAGREQGRTGEWMSASHLRLGVNIDHVATLRNARGGSLPDPLRAALVAIEAGADGITAHLREDRRHIRDDDMERLKANIRKPLNFEMAATDEMLNFALAIQPHAGCLVPEQREERTTEGGLDVIGGHDHLRTFTSELSRAGIVVSLFIEPEAEAIEAARSIGAPAVELHTGAWCNAVADGAGEKATAEFARLKRRCRKGRRAWHRMSCRAWA